MPHPASTRAALVAALTSLACAATAAAQQPASPGLQPNTITVTGTGAVAPSPSDRKSNASIAAAVEAAERAALPLAVRDGQARASRLADLSGMTLGALLAIAEAQPSPYGFFGPFGQIGTFGPGRFCGTLRTPIYVKTKQGTRKRVGLRTRRTCRVPPKVSTSLTMTFAATPPPTA